MLRAGANGDCVVFNLLHSASSWPNISDLSILSEPVPLGCQEEEKSRQHATQWLPKPHSSPCKLSNLDKCGTFASAGFATPLIIAAVIGVDLFGHYTAWHALCVLHMALINHAYLYTVLTPFMGVQSNWTISHFSTVPFFNFILISLKVFLLSAEQWTFCLAIESSRVYTIGCTQVAHEPAPKRNWTTVGPRAKKMFVKQLWGW